MAKPTRAAGPKPHKYHAKPITFDGFRFGSTKEARRWGQLKLLLRAGEIRDLERQVPIDLIGRDGPLLTEKGNPMRYIADFRYFDTRKNAVVIEDSKGHRTPEYTIKRAVLAAQGVEIFET